MKKRLPIGIQTFSEIRTENYVYIDKTGLAVDLVNHYKYVFLARPRRFGKSLFLDTLKELFEGNRPLFKGLSADHLHDWGETFPVINISFGRGSFFSLARIEESILRNITINEELHDVSGQSSDPAIRFDELITAVCNKYNKKVVVLIDEYDKPILDNLARRDVAEEARATLRAFYTVLKGSDAFIRFAFLTGVSKFSKVSIFSGLNNLKDISLNREYGTICGYTQSELEDSFAEYLDGVNKKELKQWYDGYNFLAENVYNPFDILLFFDSYDFRSYWFETGTPNMLVEMIKKEKYFLPQLSGISAGDELLTSFDIDNIDLITMLFQTGYLTIKNMVSLAGMREYTLDFPNLEVKAGLNNSLLAIFDLKLDQKIKLQMASYKALYLERMADFQQAMHALFAAIPYHNYTRNDIARYEGFYASVIYAWLASSHLPIIMEDCTSKGRIDMTIIMDQVIYIIEFKVDETGSALTQIRESGYAEKYAEHHQGKKIILIGISFDSKERNISEFEWQEV